MCQTRHHEAKLRDPIDFCNTKGISLHQLTDRNDNIFMKRNTVQNPWGISFFAKRDKIVTEEYGISESFESPKRLVREIGEVSLVFCRFKKDEIDSMYGEEERAYAMTHGGHFTVDRATGLAKQDLFEVMVMLTTQKKVEEDQMICNLWLKNKEPVFSTYMEMKPDTNQYTTVFFGGFTWWASEHTNPKVKKLLLPKHMSVLSNICVSLDSIPRQFQKKEVDEDEWDEDELYYY